MSSFVRCHKASRVRQHRGPGGSVLRSVNKPSGVRPACAQPRPVAHRLARRAGSALEAGRPAARRALAAARPPCKLNPCLCPTTHRLARSMRGAAGREKGAGSAAAVHALNLSMPYNAPASALHARRGRP